MTTHDPETTETVDGQTDDDIILDDGYDEFGYPHGFRFCPKDKELVSDYLLKKINGEPLPEVDRIYEVELNKFNPEVLYEIYKKPRESKCYFFTARKRKYRNGTRPDRAAGNGFWKPSGSDQPIVQDDVIIGYKKSLVFYNGKPPGLDGKTNWNMHEYRLNKPPREKENAQDMRLDDYVLCCIFQTSRQLNSKKRKRSVCDVEISNPNVHESEVSQQPSRVNPPPPFGFNSPPPQPPLVNPPPLFGFYSPPTQPPVVNPPPCCSSYRTPSFPLHFIPAPPQQFPSNVFDYARLHLEYLAAAGLLDPDYDPHHPYPDHVPRNDGDSGL